MNIQKRRGMTLSLVSIVGALTIGGIFMLMSILQTNKEAKEIEELVRLLYGHLSAFENLAAKENHFFEEYFVSLEHFNTNKEKFLKEGVPFYKEQIVAGYEELYLNLTNSGFSPESEVKEVYKEYIDIVGLQRDFTVQFIDELAKTEELTEERLTDLSNQGLELQKRNEEVVSKIIELTEEYY